MFPQIAREVLFRHIFMSLHNLLQISVLHPNQQSANDQHSQIIKLLLKKIWKLMLNQLVHPFVPRKETIIVFVLYRIDSTAKLCTCISGEYSLVKIHLINLSYLQLGM